MGTGFKKISRGFLTEEEKKNRPKVTLGLLKRIWSYLIPYWKQMLLVFVFIVFFSHISIYVSNFYNDFFSVCFVWFRLVFRVIFIGGSIENIVCNLCLFQALFIYAMF